MRQVRYALCLAVATLIVSLPAHAFENEDGHSIKHVLLISVDGMHAVDFLNCARGISGANNGEHSRSKAKETRRAETAMPHRFGEPRECLQNRPGSALVGDPAGLVVA